MESEQNILVFNADNEFELTVRLEDTMSLNRQQMALLFNRDIKTVGKHMGNIFKEGELKNSTVAHFATVQTEGKQHTVNRQIEHDNLDGIISVGYRVKSQQDKQFRIWATKCLKEYLLQGYAINEKRLQENKQPFLTVVKDLKLLTKDKERVKSDEVLALVENFADTWLTLDPFDKAEFPQTGNEQIIDTDINALHNDLQVCKTRLTAKKEATDLLAQEKNKGGLAGMFGSVFQTVLAQAACLTIEEKATYLLYVIVKNHSLNDGNKRSDTFAFIWPLNKYQFNFKEKINPQALASLTLVIAKSNPDDKDKTIGLVKLLLK